MFPLAILTSKYIKPNCRNIVYIIAHMVYYAHGLAWVVVIEDYTIIMCHIFHLTLHNLHFCFLFLRGWLVVGLEVGFEYNHKTLCSD